MSCLTVSIVSISSAGLSFLHLEILGKRNATPDLCRLLNAIPSNAISKTSSGFTVLTGPNFSIEFCLTNLLTSIISSCSGLVVCVVRLICKVEPSVLLVCLLVCHPATFADKGGGIDGQIAETRPVGPPLCHVDRFCHGLIGKHFRIADAHPVLQIAVERGLGDIS